MVLALQTLGVGQEDEGLGVVVELGGGLLDNGQLLVELVEGLVAECVGAVDVGGDVLVGAGEPGKDGGGKGLVGGVA